MHQMSLLFPEPPHLKHFRTNTLIDYSQNILLRPIWSSSGSLHIISHSSHGSYSDHHTCNYSKNHNGSSKCHSNFAISSMSMNIIHIDFKTCRVHRQTASGERRRGNLDFRPPTCRLCPNDHNNNNNHNDNNNNNFRSIRCELTTTPRQRWSCPGMTVFRRSPCRGESVMMAQLL
mmetsp:Transcript_32466/g.69567  ORF Transcript_32466/g.69567 Transcript_32466/m.69567 type:complete len:175 (+) Transcript_32466:1227-1751(+)